MIIFINTTQLRSTRQDIITSIKLSFHQPNGQQLLQLCAYTLSKVCD